MKMMKRVLALLLCLGMVAGLVPASVFAADGISAQAGSETKYILAGGDFQEAGDHANSAANVTNILAQISQKYETMDGFLFIGDYDCETHDSATETANGITALMGAVQGSYSNLNDANSVLVQGNHDYMDSRIDKTGGHEFDGYSAYVLNEDDYPNGGGSQAGIQTLANNLKTWLNNKIGEGYTAPIFIVSHLPLAYTPRTVTQGDAKYAKYIFDVLNDAGKNGLNIIFLHGHDHAYGPDNYMGGEAIYLPVGDKICIAEAGSTSAWTEETLNFTYMNAGYTGYYSDAYTYVTDAGTDKLTMTVFAITDNQVTVERYSEDGLYNLKSAGYDGSYSNTSVTNVSLGLPKYSAVYASPQTITLVDNGAADMGTIGEWVGMTPESTDDVTTSGNGWVTITEPVTGGIKYVLDTDGVNTNTKYLIVNTSSNGDAYVLTNNNGSVGRTQVTISNGEITVTDDTAINWIFSGTESGTVVNQKSYIYLDRYTNLSLTESGTSATFSNQGNGAYRIYRYSNSRYNYLRYSSNSWNKNSTRNETDVASVYLFAFDSNLTGTPGLYGMVDGKLTYNVVAGTSAEDALADVKDGIDIRYHYGDANAAEIFPDDGEGMTWVLDPNYDPYTPGDYAVTISFNGTVLGTAEVIVPAQTTYYIAEGNGLYLVDMNTTEANAMAAVKAGVTVYSATDASGSNKTAISDNDVTWNWVDTYNGSDSGPYTVEILYNGTSLGAVEVKVNIQYETGINTDWTYIGESEGSGGTTTVTYTLDTDGIDYGEEHKYIIVDDNEAIVLNASSASNGTAHSITISGNTATLNTRDYEYHMIRSTYNGTRYELITKGDGSQYLYQESNGVRYGTRSSVKFQVNHHGSGVYDIHDIDGTNWYIIYNGGWTVTETTSARVRLYKFVKEETTGGTPGGPIYALIEGDTVYTVTQGTSATKALAAVKEGITGYTATDANGTGKTELSDSDLTWKWKNTFNSNSAGSYWVEISYQGKVLGTVEVQVKPGTVNNYPEYPDEGAVKVNKTATGIDFQSSGIAQIELSASGVPSKKGADVILMLDTSSSMTSHTVTGTSKTRAQVLEESLANLIKQFKTPGDDGQLLDIRVAIADFNGFYGENHNSSGTPYDRDAADMMSDDISYNANSEAQIYTGDGTLGAGAFISVEDLADNYTLNYTSGTNYDYAFDAIYQMGTAIKEANGSEDRDLYVIFMSDGAAMQWNYYHSQGASSLWNNWITGAWDADDLTSTNLNCTTHAYYYDEVDHDGDGMRNEHRMANAVKGDPSKQYEVIRKTDTLGTPTGETNMYMVPGLGAKLFSISFDAQADTNVTEESMDKSIASLATPQTGSTQYYYKVTSADELNAAFNVIGAEIAYAASNARFVDQMGDNFNLQMEAHKYTLKDGTEKTIVPAIEIITYDIYTKADADANLIPAGKNIGDRKGTYSLLEVIKFSDDGKKVYSSLIDVDKDGIYGVTVNNTNGTYTYTISDTDDNIMDANGVIWAQTFLYNSGITAVPVNGVDIPTGTKNDGTTTGSTNVLPKETFYWKMGTVQTSELAMRYYVYLDGSMEGTKQAGSYATNEFAVLYYDNYLGNHCYKDTVSPTVAWKSANVSYAFYLVNENGEIIVNQTTGQTGSFANKIAITNPVIYKEILLNNIQNVAALNVAALGDNVLPTYYQIYDEAAAYTVNIRSNGAGNWEITQGDDTIASTYVTQYKINDPSAYSNELSNDDLGDDYTHTIVWFAVVWSVSAHPDTVVVDYGLPVDIHVLGNDMFGENGKLHAVGPYSESLNLDGHDTVLNDAFYQKDEDGSPTSTVATTYTGTYGTATVNVAAGTVRYQLSSMVMNGYEKFAYAVKYSGTTNAGYYYDTITVIPATTIYYEENFLTFTASGTTWEDEGTAVEGATQDEDRPGKYSLTDANNIYGYDSVNKGVATFSMGTAKKVHVDAGSYATVSFTFTGTGFDVISMASNKTGTIAVDVTDANGKDVANMIVNTYYGYSVEYYKVTYTYTNGTWVETVGDKLAEKPEEAAKALPTENVTEGQTVETWKHEYVLTPDVNKAMYQVPVLQVENLPYGTYDVKITATYIAPFDKTTADGYDLYLDAIRIYDPANNGAVDSDNVIEDAYKADGEGWPSYIELRNKLIDAATLGNASTNTTVEGLVFIDGAAEIGDAHLADYISYGPNNEVYLAPGQRVAFIMNKSDNAANVHIGLKSADGKPASYTIVNIAKEDKTVGNITVAKGTYYNAHTYTVDTATEMYYDLTPWVNGDIIVISNYVEDTKTEGILSITNIKTTYKSDPKGANPANEEGNDTLTAQTYSVRSLSAAAEETSGEEPVIYMTASATALTLRTLNTMYLPEVFEPEQLEVEIGKDKIKEGDKVKVTVETSDDVAYITVNGETVTKYRTNRRTGERTWTATLKAEEAGELNIEVVAYNGDDLASDPVIETVTVEAKKDPREIAREILKGLLGRFFG